MIKSLSVFIREEKLGNLFGFKFQHCVEVSERSRIEITPLFLLLGDSVELFFV